MASAFHYPQLSCNDMIAILNSLQIASLVPNDLKNPSSEDVSELYSRLLVNLDLHNENFTGEWEFEAVEHIDNPELYENSIGIIDLYTRVKKLLDAVGCPWDFTLKDLLRPTADRTEHFLGSILNFCLHRHAKVELLRSYGEESELLNGQIMDWKNKISELNEEIGSFKEQRDQEALVIQELSDKVKERRQNLAKLSADQTQLRNNYQNLKEELKKIEEEVSAAEFSLLQSVQENTSIRSKIVMCPKKLMSSIKEKQTVLDELKIAEVRTKESFKAKSETCALYSKALRKMSKHYKWMEAAQGQVTSAKSIEKDYKALKARLNDDEILDVSLSAKVVELEAKVQQLNEAKRLVEKERIQTTDDVTKSLNDVREQVQARRQDLELKQKNVESVLSEADAMTIETKLVSETMSAKVNHLINKREEVVKQFEQYRLTLENVMSDGIR